MMKKTNKFFDLDDDTAKPINLNQLLPSSYQQTPNYQLGLNTG